MRFQDQFKKLGRDYLAAIEGAIGCRLDADYPGKSYRLADLTAALRRFYGDWGLESSSLQSGFADYGDEPGGLGSCHKVHLADEIDAPLRRRLKNEPGIFIMMNLDEPDRVRSLLMFADALLFWDPFEEPVGHGTIGSDSAAYCLSMLKPLRPLIEQGLLVPAQLAQTRVENGGDEPLGVDFPFCLMWQGILGQEEFEKRLRVLGEGEFSIDVPEGPFAAKGMLGHADNKLASLLLPDVVIPLIDYDDLSEYQAFCRSIGSPLKAREIEYIHKSLSFETGFLLNPAKLTNDLLLELRDRDDIFAELRSTILTAVERYEEAVTTGASARFIDEFNVRLQEGFRELKAKALVSNTWKEFVDESRSFSAHFLVKVFSAPLRGQDVLSDFLEAISSASTTSVANIAVASLKTYARYRNTKVLMDVASSIRETHDKGTRITI